jgi:hypothetical protein
LQQVIKACAEIAIANFFFPSLFTAERSFYCLGGTALSFRPNGETSNFWLKK